MASENNDFWQMIIRVFVKYAVKITSNDGTESEQIYCKVIGYLRKIPEGTLQEKRCFVEALQWNKEIPKDLETIFHDLILRSFERNKDLLDMLKNYLYIQLERVGWRTVLQYMREIFTANHYGAGYNMFFEGMSSIMHEFSKYSEEVTKEALNDMLSTEIDKFFFGLGLLIKVGNLSKLSDENEKKILFTDCQMIRLMKGVLYFAVDTKKICHMAFQLLEFSVENNFSQTCNRCGKGALL